MRMAKFPHPLYVCVSGFPFFCSIRQTIHCEQGSKQLPLSDVIEEVIDHFPQVGDIQHTASLTLIVSWYQSHLFIAAVFRDI